MRPLRLDVTGMTDASGNANIPIKLPQTGEWHELKLAASTSGPAEWAILASGTAITYGRGRRVTLGPELIQDGETVTVTVSGGPIQASVTGSVTGKSGSPEEILAAYAPQPNTIALDAGGPRQQLAGSPFLVPAGTGVAKRFVVPIGAVAIRLNWSGIGSFHTQTIAVQVTSNNIGPNFFQYFGAAGLGAITVDGAGPLTVSVDVEIDPIVIVLVDNNNALLDTQVYVSALFTIEAVSAKIIGPPAPWQAATMLFAGTVAVTVNTDFTILAAPGSGVAHHLFDQTYDTNSASIVVLQLWDGPSANGVQVGEFEQNSANNRPMKQQGNGAVLGSNDALVGRCTFIAGGSSLFFTVGDNVG